jgi:hypothetical protein
MNAHRTSLFCRSDLFTWDNSNNQRQVDKIAEKYYYSALGRQDIERVFLREKVRPIGELGDG